MIDHLRVHSGEAIAPTLLLNLGRVNVICGRNNSGKSTLLRALASENQTSVGLQFTVEKASALADAILTAPNVQPTEAIVRDLPKVIADVCTKRGEWFLDDEVEFYEQVMSELRSIGTVSGSGTVNSAYILGPYKALFPRSGKRVLVPPKRSLETMMSFGASQTVDPKGTGVLNAIFFGKNQLPSASERSTFDQLRSAFAWISSGFDFDITVNSENTLALSFGSPEGKWLPAELCGLGLQDLLVILFFALERQHRFVLIEEPENHLHPEIQRKLLGFLRDRTEKQYFLTTHSNVFLDAALIDRVFFTSYNGTISVDDATSRARMLNSLGYEVTDNLVSDIVILVEGPSDAAALQGLLGKTTLLGERVIKIWPVGGDIMDQVDLSVFAERYSIIALLDRDPGSNVVRRRFTKLCDRFNIPVHRLQRYAIENYFSVGALRAIYKGQVPQEFVEVKVDEPLEKQLGGLGIKRNNRRITEAMSLADIRETDLYAFLLKVAEMSGSRLQEVEN